MFLKGLLSSILFLNVSFAEEVFVKYGQKSYSLNYSENGILFEAEGMKLSLIEGPCNKRIITRFSEDVKMALKRMPKKTMGEPGNLEVRQGKTSNFVLLSSPSGYFFRNLPEEVKRLKLQESFSCKTK